MTTDTDCIHKNNQEGLQVGGFKVGGRVRVKHPSDAYYGKEGKVGGIIDGSDLPITVEFGNMGLRYAMEELELIDTPAPDAVTRPPHYRDGTPPGIEVIDIIRAHMKAGGTWETANALKYILRHPLKDNPKQDIAKASQYLSMWTKEQEAA